LTILKADIDRSYFCDLGRLWRDYAADVDVRSFPADHLGLIHDPRSLELVSEFIEERLRKGAERPPELRQTKNAFEGSAEPV
jgi:hypothetical protein